ncbi:hypothetical protein P171DRAFT_483784 [Karstenula rhodostoma CBS 690.94]|uniref:Uncharacterized protein n=1 Tax=Karstenula rhodostoma CBS 690.94 TaxID=1392251 RepID=A0A9P4PND4_9PLEO|nr:hypothetical protein P171DRAFT_483784 [Karstenula rhodostoma CBS 690.94]
MAIVTLIFLPATAVATMFSTSFRNWMPDHEAKKNDSVVSRWIWIYFLCSIILSLAVYFLTYIMHRRERERRNRRLALDRRPSTAPSKRLRTLSTKDFGLIV